MIAFLVYSSSFWAWFRFIRDDLRYGVKVFPKVPLLRKLFDRMRGVKDWKEFDARLPALPDGWRWGTLDLYCSYKCYELAGNSMLVSHGRTDKCAFCWKQATYGERGVTLLFHNKKPSVCCDNDDCFSKAKERLLSLKSCSVCGNTMETR